MVCETGYTGNDKFMLWSKGKGCLSSIELSTEKTEDFKDFWVDPHSKKQLKPDMAIANQQATKIVGFAQDEEELLDHGFIIFQEGTKKIVVEATRFVNSIQSWECMESSLDGRVFFVGGEGEDHGVIGSITFDYMLSVESFIKVGDQVQTCETVTQIHRVIGSDHLIVAGNKFIYAYHYDNKAFNLLRIFDLAEASLISSIALRKNLLYLLDDEGRLFVRNCSKTLDIPALTLRGSPL